MNYTALTGRITKDLELKNAGKAQVTHFTLAVDNPFKKDDASFFQIEAWNKTAELLTTYCGKGSKILVEGTLKQDNFEDKEGNKRSITKVNANRIDFLDNKKDNNAQQSQSQAKSANPFANANDTTNVDDDDLPF